jgi:kumamolisin
MTLALPLRNQEELRALLDRLYDPADPIYGHYLTPHEFTDRFGPTQADYDAVAGYARSLGLTVTGAHPNRTLLDVSGPAAAVETAFNLRMQRYEAPSGREFYAPDEEPEVSDFIASRLAGVIGLENANVRHTNGRCRLAEARTSPYQIGTGPGGGLTPREIATAYNLDGDWRL